MRTLKTSLAVLICLLISQFIIKDGNPYYSAVAAALCMQPNLQNSLKEGINRVIGTVLGGAAGVVLFFLTKYYGIEFKSAAYLILTAILVIPLIYTSVWLNKKTSTNISCIVFLSIAIVHGDESSVTNFALWAVIETILGICVSLAVNHIKPPVRPNKKNLFVTDLDGTLLTSEKFVTDKSAKILNHLIKNGLNFTVATARTPATVSYILRNLNLNLPVICMNGSAIYSVSENKYIFYYTLNTEIYEIIVNIIKQNHSNCFVYVIKNNNLYVYYDEIKNAAQNDFYEERKNLIPLKTYVKGEPDKNEDITFLMLLDKTRVIDKIYNDIVQSDIYSEITLTKYTDIYNPELYSYLEIYNKNASKQNGIKYLKIYSNTKKVIAFGDNSNDIPMLEEADFSFAVENASQKVKNKADKIIGSNNEDSVAKAIKNFKESSL